MQVIAVLTGDLVNSSTAEPVALDQAMKVIETATREIGAWAPGETALFDRHRGDGWQIAMTEPARALRAALVVMASLRAGGQDALETRISIGMDEADPLRGTDLAAGHGRAFVLSGRGLDTMAAGRRLSVHGAVIEPLHHIITDLIEAHARGWTPEQAAAATLALHPANPTLAGMAPLLGISPQAVGYRLNGGAVQPIRRALTGWEEEMRKSLGQIQGKADV